jgi:molecular chaperone DnaK
MAAAKPPVAIRITRPFQTEEEFLAKEKDTISRTGVTLVGAQARPEGAVLRFEIMLASGTPLLRGEGRVVGFKEAVLGDEPGLSLRFTRLDSKSKALVDRIAAMRSAKRSIPPPLPAAARKSAMPPAPPSSDGGSVPEVPVSAPDVVAAAAAPAPAPPEPAPEPAREPPLEAAAPERAPEAAPPAAVARPVASTTPDRDAALDRLRKRGLDPDHVARILSEGSNRRRAG